MKIRLKPIYIALLVIVAITACGIVALREQDRRNRESSAAVIRENEESKTRHNARMRELATKSAHDLHESLVGIAKQSAEYERTLGGIKAAQADLKLEATLLRLQMKKQEALQKVEREFPPSQ